MARRLTDSTATLVLSRDPKAGGPDVFDGGLDEHQPSLSGSAAELVANSLRHPVTLARIQLRLAARLAVIGLGRAPMRVAAGDRRFTDPDWREHAGFRRVLQTYLAWADALSALVETLPVDGATRDRLRYVVQHVNAASAPSNLFLTHPGFYDRLIETRGASLLVGLRQFVDDWRHNHGLPRQVDPAAFVIGHDLATTAGAVVFRDPVFELIQYAPRCERVDASPILFVGPQINKYYVFDMSPHNSLIRGALDAGQSVFAISWRNPTAAQREWGLETYVAATLRAVDIASAIAGGVPVKLAGACAGGLTAAVALAQRKARGQETGVACLSLFVTLLTAPQQAAGTPAVDDRRAIRRALAQSSQNGVLDGADMARAFARLRPEDLIWRFVTHNYVLGQRPPAHDILFWNTDTTRLPARLHADLLGIYSADPLAEPGRLVIDGTPIDVGRIDCDVFVVAGASDHIAPWAACHRVARWLGHHTRFVLTDVGHAQSVACPPATGGGYQSDVCTPAESAEDWRRHAPRHAGSWWSEWLAWCAARGQPGRPAPTVYGNVRYPALDAAPGRYVRQR